MNETKTAMSIFSSLKQALEQHQQDGCKTTSEADKFVNEYDDRVETSKRSLKERQEQERQEQSPEGDR